MICHGHGWHFSLGTPRSTCWILRPSLLVYWRSRCTSPAMAPLCSTTPMVRPSRSWNKLSWVLVWIMPIKYSKIKAMYINAHIYIYTHISRIHSVRFHPLPLNLSPLPNVPLFQEMEKFSNDRQFFSEARGRPGGWWLRDKLGQQKFCIVKLMRGHHHPSPNH